MKVLFLLFYLNLIIFQVNTQVVITGFTDYPKNTISIYEINEYFTETDKKITETAINDKGGFQLIFECNEIKKVIIKQNNCYSWMYVQPNSKYFIEIPEDGQLSQFSTDNEVEMLFYRLDTADINYKILGFEAWMDNYLADIFILSKMNQTTEFVKKIIEFKKEVNEISIRDTSLFFQNYLKYSIGINVDNLNYVGTLDMDDKFSLYVKGCPIMTKNDKYVQYIKSFYENYFYFFSKDLQNQLRIGIKNYKLKDCLDIIEKNEYSYNREFAELLFLMLIQEEEIKKDFTTENLFFFVENISKNSIYPLIREIANNRLKKQAETITIGSIFPLIELKENYTINKLKGKPIYIHCFDPTSQKCISEFPALIKLHEKYGKHITIISIFPKNEIELSKNQLRSFNSIKWEKYELDRNDNTWNILNITSFPYYFLLNKDLILESAPALTPSPNASYQTIEKTFFDIKRKVSERGE